MTTMLPHGTKHICANPACQTRFYDLHKKSPACPKCHLQMAEKVKPLPKARRNVYERKAG